jgi:solute carrier family 25 2-oxodicarboxylate transporter 21
MTEKKAAAAVKIPFWTDCLMQIGAGGTAGFVEICVMHPLDVVKTRFQVQKGNSASNYTSIADCLRKTIQQEGFFAIYKGILPPILAETPKRATKFFTFEQYKKLFTFGSPTISAHGLALAGLCAGLTEAFVVNPFEVVKVRLQTDKQEFSKQTSTFGTAKKIINEGGFGLNGLNRGLTATLGRHGIWNMIYFGFYHNIKVYIPKTDVRSSSFVYCSISLIYLWIYFLLKLLFLFHSFAL